MSPNGCFTRMGASSQPMSTVMIDDLYSKRIHNTLRNIASPRQDLTFFAQLKIYYQERGLELNEKFANSLELLTLRVSLIMLHICLLMKMEYLLRLPNMLEAIKWI